MLEQNVFLKKRNLPLVFQTERTDCALSCIVMVANFHGIPLNLTELKSIYPQYKKGMNLNDVYDILSSAGMNVRVLSVDNDELGKVKLPCILHWNCDHFVVLKKIKKGKFIIHDPEKGLLKLGYVKFFDHFTGVVVESVPGLVITDASSKCLLSGKDKSYTASKNLKFFFSLLRQCQSPVCFILILLFIIEFINVCLPQVTQLIIDDVIVNSDMHLLIVAISGYFLLSLIQLVVSSAKDGILIWMTAQLGYQLPLSFYNKLMALSVSFFNERTLGDLMSRFDSVDIIKNTTTTQLLATVLDSIMVSASFVMLMIYDKSLALIVIVILFLYVLTKLFSYKVYKNCNVSTLKSRARQQGAVIESVKNHQILKLYSECRGVRGNFTQSLVDVVNNQAKAGYIQIIFTGANLFLSSLKNVSILYFGGAQVMSGHFSIGMLVAFISYSEQFCRRSMKIIDFMMQGYISGVHIERINEVITASPETESLIQSSFFKSVNGVALELSNLSFAYSSASEILSRVSFNLEPGETLLVSGKSGCGKSTLVKMVLGLLPPSGGCIICNNINITKHTIQSLRKITGTVLQGDTLLSGSLLYNITFDNTVPLDDVAHITKG
ncbi:TPA: ATP-binding cassette domain-containing protein, partial [Escherichia coli]|nr:ATP-binding cassette domain-containing protein [Escherichia coli]